jgi:hypothetical protein
MNHASKTRAYGAGGPAASSGKVKVGDTLVTVDGRHLVGPNKEPLTPAEVADLISGADGTMVIDEKTVHDHLAYCATRCF